MSSNLRKIAPDGIRPEDIQEFVVKSGCFFFDFTIMVSSKVYSEKL